MTSDALSSGKPTYVIPIKNLKSKIKKFQTDLENQNISLVPMIINYKFGNIKNLMSLKES